MFRRTLAFVALAFLAAGFGFLGGAIEGAWVGKPLALALLGAALVSLPGSRSQPVVTQAPTPSRRTEWPPG
jgi:hypothetical protein